MAKALTSVPLALLAVLGFGAVVSLHAVSARVANERYYSDALADSDVYRRLYDELLADPSFAPEVNELLGGLDLKREQVVATIQRLVPTSFLATTTQTLIGHLVVHFDHDAKLDL